MLQQAGITVGAQQRLAWAAATLHPRLAEHTPAGLLAKRGFDLIAVIASLLPQSAAPTVAARADDERLALTAVSTALQTSTAASAVVASGPLRAAVTSAESLSGISSSKGVIDGREVLDEVDAVSAARA
jgi:hypothetical protein